MILFRSSEIQPCEGYVTAVCKSPIEMDRDSPECVGREVLVNWVRWDCTGVERHLNGGPIRVGETIRLILERSDPKYF